MILSWLRQKFQTDYPDTQSDISIPPDPKLGDYSSNIAFIQAKKEMKSPMEVGRYIVARLQASQEAQSMFERIEIVPPGFINLYIKPAYLRRQLANIHAQGARYGRGTVGNGQTVILEYSSPNIAKPMHVGHLRNTMIGDALARIHEALGYTVLRWNYLGDWGTQFGKLIVAYKRWGKRDVITAAPIATLLELYVKFHEELKINPELEEAAQREFKKLEDGDVENKELWEWFRKVSLDEFNRLYARLGVRFDVVDGESNYEKDLQPLIQSLKKRGLIQESNGAFIFDLASYNLPPALVQKTDGASLYFTREIVTLQKRLERYHPAKILYVVGNEQSLHFQQLFAVAQLLNLTSAEVTHVKYGLVLGSAGQKMATREGRIIPAEEVINKAVHLAKKLVQEKNPALSSEEKDSVAESVGIGALKYNDLMEHRNSDIVFDWDRMLDFSGNSGPYLQYTYARLASIRRKAGGSLLRRFFSPDLSVLSHDVEVRIMRKLLDFPEMVRRSAELYVTNNLALYIYELANEVNRYYESVRILDDSEKPYRDARVFLLESTMTVLKNGLELLGIKTLERI